MADTLAAVEAVLPLSQPASSPSHPSRPTLGEMRARGISKRLGLSVKIADAEGEAGPTAAGQSLEVRPVAACSAARSFSVVDTASCEWPSTVPALELWLHKASCCELKHACVRAVGWLHIVP